MSKEEMKIEINQKELQLLIGRVEHAIEHNLALSTDDLKLLLSSILTLSTLQQKIEDNDVTLLKLKKLLGIVNKSEKKITKSRKGKGAKSPGKKKKKPNKTVSTTIHKITEYESGQSCPECKSGKLYKYEPGSLLRITGHAPYKAEKHITEQLRCNGCQQIHKAQLPEKVLEDGSSNQQYGYSARSLMVIYKFFSGIPYYHQGSLSEIFGLSISASTIFDQSEHVANSIMPVYYELIRQAANAMSYMIDDTHNKILQQQPEMRDNRNGKGTRLRTGVYTSGLIALLNTDKEIVLFETSLGHAGEHLDSILIKRESNLPKPLVMSDALSSNNSAIMEVEQSNCNAHCRRQFYDLEEKKPKEVGFVLNKYKNIWVNEQEIKDKLLDFNQRLKYHQEKSLPIMKELKNWALEQRDSPEFEESSALGKAVKYLLKHYVKLVKFCEIPGALIDNNRMEETLKLIIRGRKTSHFYKTANGASVANVLTSIIATAHRADINLFEYLQALQKNRKLVKKDPKLWLPWNYTKQLELINKVSSANLADDPEAT